MEIITNNRQRPTLCWHDLTPKEKRDFDWDGAEDAVFVRYKRATYAVTEFMRPQNQDAFKGWEGIQPETFFSGVLVKFADPYGDYVVMGSYYYPSYC